MTTAKRCTFGVLGLLVSLSLVSLYAVVVGGLATRARADSSAIDFETPTYTTGSINGQDGWSATGAYDYGVVATSGFGSPAAFAAQSFRISNAITSGSFGDWAFSKSLTDEAGEPLAANGGFSGGIRQPHFEVSFDIASAVPGAEQVGLQISVAPDRGDGARMSFLRFRDTPTGLEIDFADYRDVAPFGTSSNLADGCGAGDDFIVTTIATGLDRSVPHNIKLVIDFVPGPRNDVVRVFVDGGSSLVHCGTTWEDYYRYCAESQPPVDVSRTVDSLLLQARTGGGTAPGTLGYGFLVDNLTLLSGPLTSPPEVCPTATAECAAPACATPNCLVDDAAGADGPGCCTAVGGCKTIQGAVADASIGDVVSVAAGTYTTAGTLNITKTLTLCGANAGVDARNPRGPESDIVASSGMIVSADNVVVDGFTIEGNVTSAFVYGLDMAQGTTGTQVYNNIIQDNIAGIGLANTGVSLVRICQNQIQNNNQPGSATGTGIYTDEYVCGNVGGTRPCANFLIDHNAFESNDTAGIDISNTDPTAATNIDISTNTFNNGRAVLLFNADMVTIHNNNITNANFALTGSGAIRLFGGADDISITNNNLDGGNGWAIRMTNTFGLGPSTNVVINQNNIANFFGDGGPFGGGLFVGAGAHTGPVDAECNWWDDPCGPFNVAANPTGVGEEVREDGAPGDADFTPWLIALGPAPAPGVGTCTGTVCTAQFQDHYKCYRSRANVPSRTVQLADQFGTSSATVLRHTRLCNPVDKNGEGINDPTGHLSCYKLKPQRVRRDLVARNQFGDQNLTTVKTETLCLPAEKDGVPLSSAASLNHYQCYRVRQAHGMPRFTPRTVTLADQFQTVTATVVKPQVFCNPVDKNGEGIPQPDAHLTCFRLKQLPSGPFSAEVSDQFSVELGVNAFQTSCYKASLLCVPTEKNPPTTPTTTTTITTTTTTTTTT